MSERQEVNGKNRSGRGIRKMDERKDLEEKRKENHRTGIDTRKKNQETKKKNTRDSKRMRKRGIGENKQQKN